MASKTNVAARAEAKQKEKFYDRKGHEVYPIRYMGKMMWQCDDQDCPRTRSWFSRGAPPVVKVVG